MVIPKISRSHVRLGWLHFLYRSQVALDDSGMNLDKVRDPWGSG